MSVYFPATADCFLNRELDSPVSGRTPMTIAGWVKFGDRQSRNIASLGRNLAGQHRIYTGTSNDIKQAYYANIQSLAIASSTGVVSADTWYFVAATRTSLSSARLYFSELSSTPITNEVDTRTSTGTWTEDTIKHVSFGSRDLELTGGENNLEDVYLADWAAWETDLSEATLIALKNGASPDDYTTDQIGHWFTDAGDLSGSLEDELGTQDLSIVAASDGTTGSVTVPVTYSSDHPAIGSATADPVLSTPVPVTVTTTTIDSTVETDTTSGTIYAMVLAAATATPTHAAIKAGTGALGGGGVSVTCDESPETITQITGLTTDTDYKLWVTQELTGSEASTPVSVSFTTTATTNKIIATLVNVDDGDPYNSKTGIQYVVFSGTDVTDLSVEYTGTAKTTDADGVIEIPTASHSAGDDLLVAILKPTAGDIFSDDTLTALGPFTVENSA